MCNFLSSCLTNPEDRFGYHQRASESGDSLGAHGGNFGFRFFYDLFLR
jgi:hypothetical protein